MLIIDSTVALAALASERCDERLVRRLGYASELHAPDLIDIEVIAALDLLVSQGQLAVERAEYVRIDFAALRLRRYPAEIVASQVWELRDQLGAHAAAFVALAKVLGAPFATCDPELATASRHMVEVELLGPV
jgi:predicted nucleic acid-binding protein